MRVCLFIEPHRGASYDTQSRFARHAEDAGYEGLLRADHYRALTPDPGLPGPTDAWVTLAGLARETKRLRLGTLVNSATFRLPGPLSIIVAQVDQMSGGRVELGMGAGWVEREHTAYGIPFPPVGERFDRLEEQLEILTGLWGTAEGETYSYEGKHYHLVDAHALPLPVQRPHPPIIVGGKGPRRTPELAVRFADEFNMPFKTVAETAAAFDRVRQVSEKLGREKPLTLSAGIVVAIGRSDVEARRRAAPLHVKSVLPPEDPVMGSPDQLVQRIGEMREIGATRVHLRIVEMDDLDHIDLIAGEVLPQLSK
ncbi:LLM class F420-dependent oxidoreductase [Paractinoplanes lichenicola]|uniref:LLM class F420-dependent oxidoreductase n=1 Tax=Paractinoplanes lichenicola TaxID=2802976 RepID=A0ABS1VGK4_9ACTN|nr:LLM class F420-dependent oxidoreductase [Actinoplanes lichenicola]MBL7253841.1 LLM class F420-dependent oxidoreductase [Actinoplanes lichenicola]